MTRMSLYTVAGAFVASLGLAGAALADCAGHSMQSVQSEAPATVVDVTMPPMTPAPETKTGG